MARILVVEADRLYRDLVRSHLTSVGHLALGAADAAEALELTAELEFHLVIVDADMPCMDGLELARALRGRVKTCSVPIILFTARRDPAAWREATRLGIRQYSVKPGRCETLEREVTFALQAEPSEEEAG